MAHASSKGVTDLPPRHADPFDRLPIAQALSEPLRLLTAAAAPKPCSELVTLI